MKTIWKFPIETVDSQVVSMPEGAKIIAVQMQGEQPCLWALVNTEAPKKPVEIRTHGTGHPLPEDAHFYTHIGTYQLQHGVLIFHVFRVMSAAETILKSGIL